MITTLYVCSGPVALLPLSPFHALEPTDSELKIFQFPTDQIARVDGQADKRQKGLIRRMTNAEPENSARPTAYRRSGSARHRGRRKAATFGLCQASTQSGHTSCSPNLRYRTLNVVSSVVPVAMSVTCSRQVPSASLRARRNAALPAPASAAN